MIEISHLTKKFDQFVAVDDLSFSIREGEVLGFLGPNGAGKSTTMKVITGFLSPSAGRVIIDGHDISSAAPLVCQTESPDLPLLRKVPDR